MKIDIPLIGRTDVLILGGTAGACRLAQQLRRKNLRVYCVTPYSYFGEDLCATLELDRERIQSLAGTRFHRLEPVAGRNQADARFRAHHLRRRLSLREPPGRAAV
ncbi:MAG: hypothetical protein V8T86_14465 [Victivallis sp.]